MAQIGSFALLLALACSAYCVAAGVLAIIITRDFAPVLGETARRASIATFGLLFMAALILIVAAFENDFSIAYIFHHSNRDLPAPYKFAVLWSGQEGSLLFWSLLLSGLRAGSPPSIFARAQRCGLWEPTRPQLRVQGRQRS